MRLFVDSMGADFAIRHIAAKSSKWNDQGQVLQSSISRRGVGIWKASSSLLKM